MNNPFNYTPDSECEEAFRHLSLMLEELRQSNLPEDINFCNELDAGKMLGVLIATDAYGVKHRLYAFSGQLGEEGFYHRGFVEPVFDYLQPGDYFKTREKEISRQNIEIASFENGEFARIKSDYDNAKASWEVLIAEYRAKINLSKLERKAKREAGIADESEIAAMIRQSQFEKAELHRLKKRMAVALEPLSLNLKKAQTHLDMLKEKRRADSEALQSWLFSNFRLLNARGESRSLSDIFSETPMGIPPSGAGECCAPKLLQAAYRRGWTPVAIAEYWYGKSKGGEVRSHGRHYPACRGKCLPVLSWMLQGLSVEPPLDCEPFLKNEYKPEIIYENRWFCIVDKPAGMLSVPGKGAAVSVQDWLMDKYGSERGVKMAHRLDQDTSGLLMATFGEEPLKVMQSLFATRKVKKTYVAVLEGAYEAVGIPSHGRIELPMAPDWLDRPRQRIDFADGKEAVTDYEFIGSKDCHSRIVFHPLTGRTHQLRVHSASALGLGMPIAGDRLYGNSSGNASDRLLLHAQKLEFVFPLDGQSYSFESPVPF